MQGGIIHTLFALVFAVTLIALLWGLAIFFTELGSREGMKEGKDLIVGSIVALLLLMCLYAILEWVWSLLGTQF